MTFEIFIFIISIISKLKISVISQYFDLDADVSTRTWLVF